MATIAPLILIAACCIVTGSAGPDQVESRPIDGHQFTEGQTFRFVCKATGSQDFAVRLICPLSDYAPAALSSSACFENCGRPLCNQPALHNCAKTMPELLNSECNRRIAYVSADTQEITVEYVFKSASVHNQGAYTCQFKNMRSSVYVRVDATTTTTTTSTTTSTTTATTPTTSKSTTKSTTTTPLTTTTTTNPTTTTAAKLAVPSGVSRPTTTATIKIAPDHRLVAGESTSLIRRTSPPGVKTNNGGSDASQATDREGTGGRRPPTTQSGQGEGEVQLKSGWFYSSLVGKLIGIDIVLIVLLSLLAIILAVGFLFIRCQVLARQQANASAKRPLQSCCSALLCLGSNSAASASAGGTGNGGPAKSKSHNPPSARRPPAPAPSMEKRQPLDAFRDRLGSDATSGGQVYSEANLDSFIYNPGEPDRQAGGDAYYRLQTHFAEAEPRLLAGGSQRGPRAGTGDGFFSRDAPDRHSFHNVRAARQRGPIPTSLLLSGGGGGDGGGGPGVAGHRELSREEVREQVEIQRREIEQLKQQLRDSQLALSRLDSSQQNLHRSVSSSRVAAARGGGGPTTTTATTPDEPPAASSPDDYEFLTKATTPTSTELPGFAAAAPSAGVGVAGLVGGLRASADLLLNIDEPIEEEEDDSADQVEYPTVRSSKRRSSIGEAYRTGRL